MKKDKTQIPLAHFDRCVTLLFFAHTDGGQVRQCHFPSRVSNPNSTYRTLGCLLSILIPSAKRMLRTPSRIHVQQTRRHLAVIYVAIHVKKAQRPTVIANSHENSTPRVVWGTAHREWLRVQHTESALWYSTLRVA